MSAFGSFGAPKPAGGSIFGQPSTGTSSFGAFGQPTSTQPTAQAGGAFGAGTGSTFGGFGGQQQQQPQQQPTAVPAQTGFGSGPGTGNTFGGFGGQQQPQQPPTAPAQTGFGSGVTGNVFGGFGGQQQQPQQPQQPQQQPTAAPAQTGFGSFGANAQPSQPPQQPTQPTQLGGGGTFGSFGQPQQAQPSQPGPTGFGGAFGAGLSATPQTGGFGSFGATKPTTNPAASVPPSFFGAASSAAQPAATSSASPFGSFGASLGANNPTQPQQQQPAAPLFGGASFTAQPAQTTFGSTTFGQSTAPFDSSFGGLGVPKANPPSGASVLGQNPGLQQQPSSLTKGTKYTDLPAHIQQALDRIQEQFQNQLQISSGLKARSLGENARKPIVQLEDMAPATQGLFSTIVSDEEVTLDLRAKLDQAIIDETIATQIIDGFQDVNKATNLQTHAGFPLEYFSRLAGQLAHRLQTYKTTVDVIEHKIISLTENHHRSPQMISSTLRTQHATFQALASRVAELESVMKKIRERATVAWRTQTGSARDPFDQRQGGLDSSSLGRSIFGQSTS